MNEKHGMNTERGFLSRGYRWYLNYSLQQHPWRRRAVFSSQRFITVAFGVLTCAMPLAKKNTHVILLRFLAHRFFLFDSAFMVTLTKIICLSKRGFMGSRDFAQSQNSFYIDLL